jgi:hypothetical protein
MKIIQLTQGKTTIVDDEDYAFLSQFKWCIDSSGYAYRRNGSTTITMHRFLMNPPAGMETDHINRNKLDNRKSNLRLCTHAQNLANRTKYKTNKTGFKGVSYYKRHNCFRAQISSNGVNTHIGYFKSKEEAYAAYIQATVNGNGEFACIL